MPFTKANRINLYYEFHGEGEPLILIGGLAADHLGWESVLPELSKSFRVIIFDNRGAGQSDITAAPYTTKLLADDVVALLDNLNVARAHVLGHSMGGAIAQQMGLHYPDKIHRLIIASSFARRTPVTALAINITQKLMEHKMPLSLIAEYNLPWLYSNHFLSDEKKQAAAIARMIDKPYPITSQGYQNQAHACLGHNTDGALNQIKTPTLVLAGEEDILVLPEVSKQMAVAMPNAIFKTIARTAHLAQVEKPREFTQVIRDFLR